MAEIAIDVPEHDRDGFRRQRHADFLRPRRRPAGDRIAGGRDAREVALNVGGEDIDALARERFGQGLQRHGFAGAGGPGDQAVPVGALQSQALRPVRAAADQYA